jgi:hypothetical protein
MDRYNCSKDEHCYTIDIYDEDLEEENWGYFVDIEIDIENKKIQKKRKKRKKIYIDDFKKMQPNISIVSLMLIRISSTTLFTIGVTYFILSIL